MIVLSKVRTQPHRGDFSRLGEENVREQLKEEYAKRMADKLKCMREKTGLNIKELSERCGISRQTISKIEQGKLTMRWDVFMSILCVFRHNDEAAWYLEQYEIFTDELCTILDYPKSENKL